MANSEQFKRLKQGITIWNDWHEALRDDGKNFEIDLSRANLSGANLSEANLIWALLSETSGVEKLR